MVLSPHAGLVLTGARGFVARALRAAAAEAGIEVTALDRAALDVTDADAVDSRLRALAPAVVVNAAAFNDNDAAESEPSVAFRVNETGPANLAAACEREGAWLLHLSTDSVFGALDTVEGHHEDAAPAPVNAYARSKLAGERAVAERTGRYAVLRLAWQFGPGDRSFVGTVTRRALREPEVRIAEGQRGCPTPAEATAHAVLALVDAVRQGRCEPGVYHFCSDEAVTRMALAEAIVEALRSFTRPRVERLVPVPAEQLDRAERPRASVLDCSRFTALTGMQRPPWRPALESAVRAIAAEESGASRG